MLPGFPTPSLNLVPRAFPLNGWGAPPIFLREKPWGRGCPSLRSRRCTRKNVCARRRHARGDLTPRVSPSRAPVLSFAHNFQAPATQAILLQTLFQTKTRIFHRPVFRPGLRIHIPVFSNLAFEKLNSVWEPITSSK